jgi:hypothetical protein
LSYGASGIRGCKYNDESSPAKGVDEKVLEKL